MTPSTQTDITSPRHSCLEKYKNKDSNLWSTLGDFMQQLSLFDGQLQSKARRIRPHQRSHPTTTPHPPTPAHRDALHHYQTTAAAKNISKAAPMKSAHRHCYLSSIELFQMKCEGVSHSPGLFCVLAQCVGSLFMIHVFPVWMHFLFSFLCCRLAEPPPLSGCSPKREL